MKYHINRRGEPALCHAFERPCPFGGSDYHYDSLEDAQKAADEMHKEKYGLLATGENTNFVNKMPRISDSCRPYKGNDCTIISLGNVTGLTYKQADRVLKHVDYIDGEFVRIDEPRSFREFRKHGNLTKLYSRMWEPVEIPQAPSFGMFNMEGRYLIAHPTHIAASIDGVLYDSWDSSNGLVLTAYKVTDERLNQLREFMSKHRIFNDD